MNTSRNTHTQTHTPYNDTGAQAWTRDKILIVSIELIHLIFTLGHCVWTIHMHHSMHWYSSPAPGTDVMIYRHHSSFEINARIQIHVDNIGT